MTCVVVLQTAFRLAPLPTWSLGHFTSASPRCPSLSCLPQAVQRLEAELGQQQAEAAKLAAEQQQRLHQLDQQLATAAAAASPLVGATLPAAPPACSAKGGAVLSRSCAVWLPCHAWPTLWQQESLHLSRLPLTASRRAPLCCSPRRPRPPRRRPRPLPPRRPRAAPPAWQSTCSCAWSAASRPRRAASTNSRQAGEPGEARRVLLAAAWEAGSQAGPLAAAPLSCACLIQPSAALPHAGSVPSLSLLPPAARARRVARAA